MAKRITHETLVAQMKTLPTDYTGYGCGTIERWRDGDDYPDCSAGCVFFAKLKGPLGYDWGVCANPSSPRSGLLTFEHQAGRGCFMRSTPTPGGAA